MMRFLVVLILLLAAPAWAQPKDNQKSLGGFGTWKAYSYKDNGQPVCYMVKAVSFPKTGKFKRGPAYLMITHRPAENSNDVVSYTSGYNFKTASDVTASSGKNSFDLFTQKDTAWSRDAKTDHALASLIRDGAFIKMKGFPADTKYMSSVTDTLDVKGAGAAYKAIGVACGLLKDEQPKKIQKIAPAPKKKHK